MQGRAAFACLCLSSRRTTCFHLLAVTTRASSNVQCSFLCAVGLLLILGSSWSVTAELWQHCPLEFLEESSYRFVARVFPSSVLGLGRSQDWTLPVLSGVSVATCMAILHVGSAQQVRTGSTSSKEEDYESDAATIVQKCVS